MPGGIRTPNLLIRSQLLYPVELQTQLPEGAVQSHGTHENLQAPAHSRSSPTRRGKELGRVDLRPAGVEGATGGRWKT